MTTDRFRMPIAVVRLISPWASGFARGRGKTRQREGADARVSQGVGAETPIDRLGRLQPDRVNQVLIAAISGPTPKIVIIRFRL